MNPTAHDPSQRKEKAAGSMSMYKNMDNKVKKERESGSGMSGR